MDLTCDFCGNKYASNEDVKKAKLNKKIKWGMITKCVICPNWLTEIKEEKHD